MSWPFLTGKFNKKFTSCTLVEQGLAIRQNNFVASVPVKIQLYDHRSFSRQICPLDSSWDRSIWAKQTRESSSSSAFSQLSHLHFNQTSVEDILKVPIYNFSKSLSRFEPFSEAQLFCVFENCFFGFLKKMIFFSKIEFCSSILQRKFSILIGNAAADRLSISVEKLFTEKIRFSAKKNKTNIRI